MSSHTPAGLDDEARGDPVEEAGETTAADSVEAPPDTRPVGAGTLVETESGMKDDGE
jgi:hypothetical protein